MESGSGIRATRTSATTHVASRSGAFPGGLGARICTYSHARALKYDTYIATHQRLSAMCMCWCISRSRPSARAHVFARARCSCNSCAEMLVARITHKSTCCCYLLLQTTLHVLRVRVTCTYILAIRWNEAIGWAVSAQTITTSTCTP